MTSGPRCGLLEKYATRHWCFEVSLEPHASTSPGNRRFRYSERIKPVTCGEWLVFSLSIPRTFLHQRPQDAEHLAVRLLPSLLNVGFGEQMQEYSLSLQWLPRELPALVPLHLTAQQKEQCRQTVDPAETPSATHLRLERASESHQPHGPTSVEMGQFAACATPASGSSTAAGTAADSMQGGDGIATTVAALQNDTQLEEYSSWLADTIAGPADHMMDIDDNFTVEDMMSLDDCLPAALCSSGGVQHCPVAACYNYCAL